MNKNNSENKNFSKFTPYNILRDADSYYNLVHFNGQKDCIVDRVKEASQESAFDYFVLKGSLPVTLVISAQMTGAEQSLWTSESVQVAIQNAHEIYFNGDAFYPEEDTFTIWVLAEGERDLVQVFDYESWLSEQKEKTSE